MLAYLKSFFAPRRCKECEIHRQHWRTVLDRVTTYRISGDAKWTIDSIDWWARSALSRTKGWRP